MRFLPAFLMVSALSTASAAQNTVVAPPPRQDQPMQNSPANPPSSGPSLNVTMQFIAEKINEIGKVNATAFFQDTRDGSTGSYTLQVEFGNAAVQGDSCSLIYYVKRSREGKVLFDGGGTFSFREAVDVTVQPVSQQMTDITASSGSPNLVVTSTNPNITALTVRMPHGGANEFDFKDASLADRVAKAMTHAIELCGGGNKEPF